MTEPLTVTALTMALKGLLEDAFPGVLVKGEITNWRPAASGHTSSRGIVNPCRAKTTPLLTG